MKNYRLFFEGWAESHTIATDAAAAKEIFAALCDFYGIESDEIQTESDDEGLARAYSQDEAGDFVALIKRVDD